ncbi:MAG: hypothetical protein M1820_006577 [Bogoriella megaspora]|nr:MAG: hypothetical protein M1820_006577 [Bogoriella megaspora]
MAATAPNVPNFQWIDQSTELDIAKNGASRRAIRKQAMRSVCNAKRTLGIYRKINLRQQPVFVEGVTERCEVVSTRPSSLPSSPSLSNETSSYISLNVDKISSQPTDPTPLRDHISPINQNDIEDSLQQAEHLVFDYGADAWPAVQGSIPPALPLTGYELAKVEFGVDITQLAALAKVTFGRGAIMILSQQQESLSKLLMRDVHSFLEYVPNLFDESDLVQSVTRCTLARARHSVRFAGKTPCPYVMSMYIKALKDLQTALDDPGRLQQPDVLCATQILALFELLNFSEGGAWIPRAVGAAKLIELRGPNQYQSDFEKSLLMSHAGPLFSEALLNNEASFFERPEWQQVVQSTVIDGLLFCDRSQISISLWLLKYRIPGLARQVTTLVCTDGQHDQNLIHQTLLEVQELKAKFLEWRSTYDYLVQAYPDMSEETQSQARSLLAICLVDLVLVNRLMMALDPVGNWVLEDQVQALATLISTLERKASETGFRETLFMSQKMIISQAVVHSEADWRMSRWRRREQQEDHGLIERWVFERWCSLMGRVTK